MSFEKVSAERDALLHALKQAGEEITRSRTALRQAEATARSMGEQLQAQKAEFNELRATVADFKAENENLRNQNEELLARQDQQKQNAQDAPSPAQPKRDEVKWLRQELDTAKSEIQRLRNLVVQVASESRRRGSSPESLLSPKADPKTVAGSRPAPPTPSPAPPSKASKVDVDTTPRSGVHWAA